MKGRTEDFSKLWSAKEIANFDLTPSDFRAKLISKFPALRNNI